MKTSARLFLLLTGVLTLAYYLPAAYWLVAAKRQRSPIVFYSSVEKRFLFSRFDGEGQRYTDAGGKIYDRDDFERLLPLTNWAQLTKDGRMPKQIDGVPLSLEAVRRAQFSVRLDPAASDTPSAKLFPLLEAESGRARLELPPDFLRLGSGVEFLDPKSNLTLPEKSARFAAAFASADFKFPVRLAASNPTNRKPYDEGAYLIDAAGDTFRLRQVRGEPELRRVADLAAQTSSAEWRTLRPKLVHVQEIESRELHALLVGEDGQLRLAIGPDYRLVPVPLRAYDYRHTNLSLRGNLLHRLLVAETDTSLQALVFDRDYRLIDRYEEALTPRADTQAGRTAKGAFPFSWSLTDESSGYLGFYATLGSPWVLLVNAALLAAWLLWKLRRNKRRAPPSLLEGALIAVTGVYGLIVVLVAPSSE